MFSVCFSGVRFFVRVFALAQHSFLFNLFFFFFFFGCWLVVVVDCWLVWFLFVFVCCGWSIFLCLAVLFCVMLNVCFSDMRFFGSCVCGVSDV